MESAKRQRWIAIAALVVLLVMGWWFIAQPKLNHDGGLCYHAHVSSHHWKSVYDWTFLRHYHIDPYPEGHCFPVGQSAQ